MLFRSYEFLVNNQEKYDNVFIRMNDFNHMYDTFQIISKDIRVEEVGFCAPLYIGVIYDKNNVPSSESVLDLVEKNMLPETADKSIYKNGGQLDQRDLILPWLDQSLVWYGQQ